MPILAFVRSLNIKSFYHDRKIVFKPRFWEMSLVVFYVNNNSFCLLLLIMSNEKIKKDHLT